MTHNKQRIEAIDFSDLPIPLQVELDRYKNGRRSFPNFLKVLANAPTILEAYFAFGQALEKSSLPASIREKIALAVSELNSSEYDVAAHTEKASDTEVTKSEIKLSRLATSANNIDASLLNFAKNVVSKRGILTDAELEEARRYQSEDSLIVEVVATIAHVHFANLINNIADTKIDYPAVKEISHKTRKR